VQSLAPHVLAGLGRTHSPEVAVGALAAAKRAGASNLNADLIYGSQWESQRDWVRSVEGVVAAEPEHISAYALTVEEGTPLATLVATGRLLDVDPDVQAERYELADAILTPAGYHRYEISNWALPGRASRHNVLYWAAGDYVGFGAGAHSHLSGRRSWALRLPRDFVAAVAAGAPTEAGHEILDLQTRWSEAMVLGLRLTSGIDLVGLTARFGERAVEETLDRLTECLSAGLVELNGDRVRLTSRGVLFHSEVARALL
ncbi:MAG: coproporphyrinogen III oxidase, partial [Actinomycetota bacterium]|nr:coproporphyrinogen III oxidase [Actinomycetota bacterium]